MAAQGKGAREGVDEGAHGADGLARARGHSFRLHSEQLLPQRREGRLLGQGGARVCEGEGAPPGEVVGGRDDAEHQRAQESLGSDLGVKAEQPLREM